MKVLKSEELTRVYGGHKESQPRIDAALMGVTVGQLESAAKAAGVKPTQYYAEYEAAMNASGGLIGGGQYGVVPGS